jgi:hypothetical protein
MAADRESAFNSSRNTKSSSGREMLSFVVTRQSYPGADYGATAVALERVKRRSAEANRRLAVCWDP